MHWQLQEAKNKLSRVVQLAKTEGPQVITVRGAEEAVVISSEEYRRLTKRDIDRDIDFVAFLEQSPWVDVELDTERSRDTGRDIEL
jgi:prevent-host-death family protein